MSSLRFLSNIRLCTFNVWDANLYTSSIQVKNDDWFYNVLWSLDCIQFVYVTS